MGRHSAKSFIQVILLIAVLLPLYEVIADVFTEYLTGREIYAIVYDSKRDLIWFGTSSSGLASFDGTRFTEYDASNSDLRDNFVRSLAVDHDGDLWVGTDTHGLGRFNPEKGTWTFYDDTSGLVNNRVRSLAIDDFGRVWCGTDGGAGFFDRINWYRYTETDYSVWEGVGSKWNPIESCKGKTKHLSNRFVHTIAVDSSDNIWFGTEAGASMLKGECEWEYSLSRHKVWSIFIDNEGNRWFGTNKKSGNSFYRLADGEAPAGIEPVAISCFLQAGITSRTDVHAIVADQDGRIWLGTNYGPFSFDPARMSWRCTSGSADLDRKTIRNLATDEDGNIWFGSRTTPGATKYTANWVTFSTANGDSIENDEIFSMAQDQLGQIWIGTKRAVARFDGSSWHPKIMFPTRPKDTKNKIMAIAVARDTTLWLGTDGGGVIQVDRHATKIDSFTFKSTRGGLVSNFIQSITIDREFVWVGTAFGLSRLHIQDTTRTFDTTFTVESTGGSLLSNQIKALAVDLQGRLWCGTPSGISRYDGTWTTFTTKNTGNGLRRNEINSITVDRESGRLWFGTDGGGASSFLNGIWESITIDAGLTDNFVKDVFVHNDNGEIWFATGGGVSVVNHEGRWTTYTTIDGLADNHVTELLADTATGALWFGTRADGVTQYRRQDRRPDTAILTSLDVTTQSLVEFNYMGNDLNTTKGLLRYSHKLDNEPWSEYTFDTSARIKVTTSGVHTFYVIAIDRDGNEDRTPATKTFYKFAPDTGATTIVTDSTRIFDFDSVRISLYWPPDRFREPLQVSVAPVAPGSFESPPKLAYDFRPFTTNIRKKGVILSFEFPIDSSAPDEEFSINRLLDSRGQKDNTRLGGTQQVENGFVKITTAIDQFGRYEVRAAEVSAQESRIATADVNAQPRIFSPAGGGHGAETTLSFQLPQRAHVRIRVYNLAGRLINTIWDDTMSAGINAVAWNGRDRNHQICPSGLYIMVVESSVLNATKKVMVLNE